MKLRTKLLLSYVLLITIAFFVFYIVSVPLVRNYIKKNVEDGLQQETTLIRTRTNAALSEVEDREGYFKALANERVAVERLGLSSKIGLLYFNKNTSTFIDANNTLKLHDEAKELIKDKLISIDTTPFETTINDTTYLATYFLPPASRLAAQRIVVLVYTPLDSIKDFTRGFTRITILVFLAVMVAAVIIALIFAEKINNPVIKLKKQAAALQARDFDTRSIIKTGDEFEELSNALNAAATELSANRVAQQEFLDNISHELKTPLMSIQGYAEGIKDGIFPADKETLGIITDESIRLKKLVGEISYLSKLESMPDFYKKDKVEMSGLINKSMDAVSGLQKARSIRILKLNLVEYKINGDAEKLLQLMINILSNSVRYCDKTVFIDTAVRDEKYVITVKDDGTGFPPGEEQKIFRRFYKGAGGNTGLGLSIALAIAQNHGGSITAWNASPRGAVFEITLAI